MALRALSEISAAVSFGLGRTVSATRARSGALLGKREQQYGGRTFTFASEFLRASAGGSMRELRRVDIAKGIAASATLLSRLPRVSFSLSDSPGGQSIRAHLAERRLGVRMHRLAQGVLIVPPSIDEYLRGRHRQALRTNLRHARSLGIRCRHLTTVEERRRFADLLDPDLTDPWKREQMLSRPEADAWVAIDAEGEPVGLAVLTVDDEAALLWSLVSTIHPARWLLHTEVVEWLTRRGVRYLLVNARMAPLLPPGIQHLQRLLAYRVTHISPRG